MKNYYIEVDNKWDNEVSAASEESAVALTLDVPESAVKFVGCEDDVSIYSVVDAKNHSVSIVTVKDC